MKFKKMLKERVKERIDEATASSISNGANNSTRYTPPGQERVLTIPQLSGFIQMEKPEADDPMPEGEVADGPNTYMDKGIGYQYNNKVRRDDDGELTASGMPGEAYASPGEYVSDHEEMDTGDTDQTAAAF
jgi:hypothetical protein